MDIEVYDESGTLVGRTKLETYTLTDDETGEEYTYTVSVVDESVTTIDLIVLGDSKRVLFPDDQNYRIVIKSNDNFEDGDQMRYAVSEYANGTPVSSIVYSSVELSNDAGFDAEVTTSDNNIRTCTLLSGSGDLIEPTEVIDRQGSYTVTLNANGGEINSGNIDAYTEGVGATLPTDVTRDNDTFGGWYETENFEGAPVTEISATDTGDKTFYAKWISVVLGDINGDESVSMKDLSLLRRYLNGWEVQVVSEAMDVNADGSVTMKDFSLLRRYLNGWPVTLGANDAGLLGVAENREPGEIAVGEASAKVGDTVTIPLTFKSNPGIVAYRLYVSYDKDALELLEGKAADFKSVSFGPVESVPFNILWDESLNGNVTGAAAIAELTFRIKEGISGYSSVSVTYNSSDIYDRDLANVPFNVSNGGIEIVSSTGENRLRKVTVTGGSGSGEYGAGDSVTIHADPPPEGKVFDRWIGTNGIQFISGSQNSADAIFRMPDGDVALNATFRDQKLQGCYVATAVYGSYDCPEVWTLRRFRDNVLAKTWYGRLFIRLYYAVSPTAVRLFGDAQWFRDFWRERLNRMVTELQSEGFESTPYMDRDWN